LGQHVYLFDTKGDHNGSITAGKGVSLDSKKLSGGHDFQRRNCLSTGEYEMNIIRVSNYEEMSIKVGELIAAKVRLNPNMTLGLATGSTPSGVYKYMIKDHILSGTSYQNIHTINLDEYVGLSASDPNSYHYFMKKNLFDQIDILESNNHIPNGDPKIPEVECERYENLLKNLGGIDLQLLGIGQNGHIGFNEPGTPFNTRTHIVTLAQSTREANSRFFASIESVPKQAITMGIDSIMESKEIFLLASGDKKAPAISRLLTSDISESFPASVLKHHQNVTLIADDEALKYI
jgi:glucosamine-6-phosphate deaminase